MHGDSVMYVIDYDEKRKKYKFLDIRYNGVWIRKQPRNYLLL